FFLAAIALVLAWVGLYAVVAVAHHTTSCKSLLHSAIRLHRTSKHRNATLIERNDVFATCITGIYKHLFLSLTCTLFDLLHRVNKMFIIRSYLGSINSDDNSGGGVRRHLHVIAQCTRCS